MTNPAQPEPSMEEILASIRRIISEDPAATPAAAAPAAEPFSMEAPPAEPDPGVMSYSQPPADAAGPLDEVFELTPDMRAEPYSPPAPEPAPAPYEPEPYTAPVDNTPPYTPPPVESAYVESHTKMTDDEALMSPHTEAVTAAALAGLTTGITSRSGFEGHTVETVVRELLRPMLREWMDGHLPTIVERLVEAEIERLARRRS